MDRQRMPKTPAVEAGLGVDAERITHLRTQITKLTGRVTISRDLPYLEQRYASLRKAKADGKRMPNAARPDPSSVVSVSLTRKRTQLLARICKERKVGASAVVKEAFDAWAKTNGYRTEIEHINRIDTQED